MADTDFYNRNLYRRYPLVDERYVFANSALALDSLVVDAGIVLLPDSGFNPDDATHRVYFSGYGLSGGLPALELAFYAPGAAINGLTHVVTFAAGDMQFSSFQLALNYGYGFVVNGAQDSFGVVEGVSSVASAIALAPGDYPYIERRCVTPLLGHFVTRVVVANEPRTKADCQQSSSASTGNGYPIAPNGEQLVGDIVFQEGYNCSISVVQRSNAIRFAAIRGAGQGEACDEIPRTYEELERKAAGLPLDCATRCHETITSINGIVPSSSGGFSINAGVGIAITAGTASIDISTRAAADNCHGAPAQNSSSSSSSQ